MDDSVSTSSSLESSVSPSKHKSTPDVDDSMDNSNPVQGSGKGKGKQRSVYDPVLLDLIVQTSTGDEKTFRLKNTTPLGRVFRAFAYSYGKDVESLRFVYQGERIDALRTLAMYGMANADIIDVMIEQIGGAELQF